MNQKITGYHKDFEDHWVAELECGHAQHVRHDPPFVERVWVTSEERRNARIGTELNCVRCDEMGLKIAQELLTEFRRHVTENYESAGISGLCDEGRWEAAIGSLGTIELKAVVNSALKSTK